MWFVPLLFRVNDKSKVYLSLYIYLRELWRSYSSYALTMSETRCASLLLNTWNRTISAGCYMSRRRLWSRVMWRTINALLSADICIVDFSDRIHSAANSHASLHVMWKERWCFTSKANFVSMKTATSNLRFLFSPDTTMLILSLCFLDISQTRHFSFYIFKISVFLKIFMVIWWRIDL